MMESALVFSPLSQSILRLPSFASMKLGRLGFSLKEIADGPSFFTSRSNLQFPVSIIRAEGHRKGKPPQTKSNGGTSPKSDETKIPQSSESSVSNTSNQDEILALFRRIQSSISKGESTSSNKRTSKPYGKKPSAESVLEVHPQSQKQVKGKLSNKEGSKVSTQRTRVLKKEDKVHSSTSTAEVKATRPPSNFVKRSPIPPPPTIEHVEAELKSEARSAKAGEELATVEEMKLSALKELAKSRGIKGYSKLKKSELIDLLRS